MEALTKHQKAIAAVMPGYSEIEGEVTSRARTDERRSHRRIAKEGTLSQVMLLITVYHAESHVMRRA